MYYGWLLFFFVRIYLLGMEVFFHDFHGIVVGTEEKRGRGLDKSIAVRIKKCGQGEQDQDEKAE